MSSPLCIQSCICVLWLLLLLDLFAASFEFLPTSLLIFLGATEICSFLTGQGRAFSSKIIFHYSVKTANCFAEYGSSLICSNIFLNTACWVLTKIRKAEHITPLLRSLHWLPVSQRTDCYKLLNSLGPKHISERLSRTKQDEATFIYYATHIAGINFQEIFDVPHLCLLLKTG